MHELIIVNGKVFMEDKVVEADIFIDGGKISKISQTGNANLNEKHNDCPGSGRLQSGGQERTIDAAGKFVLPGIINPHVHTNLKIQGVMTADLHTTSVAAAYGGVTTFIDYAKQIEGKSLVDSIKVKEAEINQDLAVDYALHLMLFDGSWDSFKQLAKVFEYGVTSCKAFMTTSGEGPALDDGSLFHLFNLASDIQMVVMLHAENQSLLNRFTNDYLELGKTDIRYFGKSHPDVTESEAVNRALYLSQTSKCPIYFCHISTADAMSMIALSGHNGRNTWAETCPHYLLFDASVYEQEFDKAMKFIRFPSIKDGANKEVLWEGITHGGITAIGTDDVALPFKEKKKLAEGKPFNKLPGGMAQIELELPIIYTEAVVKRGIDLQKIIKLLSTNPAKIFGLYPQKGVIRVGADADLVIFDPQKKWVVDPLNLHMGTGYSIYDGCEVAGAIEKTIIRGKVVVDNGKCICETGGSLIKRHKFTNIS